MLDTTEWGGGGIDGYSFLTSYRVQKGAMFAVACVESNRMNRDE